MPSSAPTYFPVRPADPAVRPLPFPYRGALAISNDAEYLEWEFFDGLMRFLNTRGDTPLGPGLGLRVTSSLFFFSAPNYNVSYFDGAAADSPRSRHADRLDAYLRSGLVDTIHAYGDFDGVGGCTRQHAEAAYRALARLGVRLEAFSNHGSTDNIQNVGSDASYHCGDRPGHAAYHADLMADHGVRYVWTDSLVTPPADGGGWRSGWRRLGQPRPDILTPAVLQDGRVLTGFRRLRGTGACAPNLSSLHAQVAQLDWAGLYASGGATFLYQHLGVLRRVAGVCEAATLARVRERPEVHLAPFRRLQREQDEGRLWVCGCVELLRYLDMVRSVRIRRSGEGGIELDVPHAVADPRQFFAGLTVTADPRRTVAVRHRGLELPLDWNGPEGADGGYSVTVKRPEQQDPW
jgi:hypothetical protein